MTWNPFRQAPSPTRSRELSDAAIAAMLPNGAPTTETAGQFFELYKLIVASSEALVARRQGVNTFFLTINGLLLTAIGLFLKSGGNHRLQAGGILILALTGLFLGYAWRSLLVSFGQLNRGKFRVINSMEIYLAAAIYAGEWRALADGSDNSVYRSFTEREASVPLVLGAVYLITASVAALVWTGVFHIGM